MSGEVLVHCPDCGLEMWASLEDAGTTLKCTRCSGSVRVPELRERPASSPSTVAAPAQSPSSSAASSAGDENPISSAEAAFLVWQGTSRINAPEDNGSPKAAFLYGLLTATGVFAVVLLVGYVVFVRDAGPEQPLADKPVASAVEPEEVQERPQEKATERKSDKARDETPDTALSLPALPSEPKKSTEESVRKDEPPQPAQPTSLTPKEIVARCGRSVALITGKLGSGSGFLLGPNVLATNAHVVKLEFLEDIHVYFPSAIAEDRGPSTPNAVFYENETRDLALISLRSALPPLELARDDEFAPGEEIVIIGSPGLAGGSPIPNAINQGILSTRLNDHGRTLYQLGASINPGNSGGPIFNSAGRVVGVALARGKGVEALAFSIPAGDVRVAMDIVAGQSQEKTLQATARHRAIVAFHRLDLLGSHFGAGLDQSVAGMVAAAQKKLPLQEGLKAARQLGTIKINDNVVNLAQVIATDTMRFTPGLEAAVSRVSSDPLVDQLVKDKLVELLKTCIEMKDYLDRPRGTLPAFQEKRTELISRHKRLVESLRNLLEANLR